MTAEPGEWRAPDAEAGVFSTPVEPEGARRLRSATAKMAALCALPVVTTGAIAIGGRTIDDPALRVQQVSAGTLTVLGAALMVTGILRVRSSVGEHVIDNSGLRRAALYLTAAAVLAWLGVAALWVLGLAGDGGSDAALNAAVLSVPLGATAVIASFVRRLPRRLVPRR